MPPTDFTIEFYRKCLSQAKWHSSDEQDVESRKLLQKVATERGGEFREFYSEALYKAHKYTPKHFPVAEKPATENPKPNNTNTTMNTLLNDIYEILVKPIVDAIDRNTAAKGAAVALDATPPSFVKEDEDKPEPKKRGPKAKAAEAAPEPETPRAAEPEPTPVEEEPYLSGPELVELMKPLKDTKYTKLLVDFRDNTLGFPKMTREMSDPTMLRQMEAKIREFLAANEEDQNDAA